MKILSTMLDTQLYNSPPCVVYLCVYLSVCMYIYIWFYSFFSHKYYWILTMFILDYWRNTSEQNRWKLWVAAQILFWETAIKISFLFLLLQNSYVYTNQYNPAFSSEPKYNIIFTLWFLTEHCIMESTSIWIENNLAFFYACTKSHHMGLSQFI